MARRIAPRSAGKDAESVDRRRDLLDAAFALVAEKGLEGLRTRDVVARAGVNISTLHYYFGTKSGLVAALVHDIVDAFKAPQRARTAETPGTLSDQFVRTWQTFQARPQLAVVLQELTLRARRDAATRTALRTVIDDWTAKVEVGLRQGIEYGGLRSDLDPRAGAVVLTSFIMGAIMQLGVSPRAFAFADVSREVERWLARASR